MQLSKRNIWVDMFGWCFLIPSIYRTLLVAKYLQAPYLEHIDYKWYPTLHDKLSITAEVWVIPIVNAIVCPLFILIGMGIIFRQAWARVLLVSICVFELVFVSTLCLIATLFRMNWMAKTISLAYIDEILWFAIIPILCIYIFSQPKVKKLFN